MRFPIRLIPLKTNLNFMRMKWLALGLSVFFIVATVVLVATKGLNFGIDFTGGVVVEMRTKDVVDLGHMREALSKYPELGEVNIQYFGSDNDILLRIQPQDVADGEQLKAVNHLKEILGNELKTEIEYRKVDYVGPQVGKELVTSGVMALGLALLAMMAYIWFRFEWQFGLGGIFALFHDAMVTVGFFCITGLEFNLTSIAAILTIIGYSINDSVVIYDRIRENLRKFKKMPLEELINLSVNETLSRTILTSSTTIITLIALVLLGGEVIKGFCLAMLFGIVVGTYSSIYISAPVLVFINPRQKSPENAVAKPA
ncbi:MAG: protein translocase subunit SecF [Proteobacteria bacterium]|nr:protein translocase subunit SecF [Pseudomonadota bacterium]